MYNILDPLKIIYMVSLGFMAGLNVALGMTRIMRDRHILSSGIISFLIAAFFIYCAVRVGLGYHSPL